MSDSIRPTAAQLNIKTFAPTVRITPWTFNSSDLGNLPPALEPLKLKPRWVLWRWERLGMRWTKVPLQPDGKSASVDDPKSWHAYEQVVAALRDRRHGFSGLGYVLTGDMEILALDVDDCRNDDGVIDPWVMRLIKRANTYAELTPSGSGLRIVGTGGGVPVHRTLFVPESDARIEFYRHAVRYITITGNQLPETADALNDITEVFDAVLEELAGVQKNKEDNSDEDRLEQTLRDGGGDRYGGDRSRALFFVITEMLKRGYTREHIADTLVYLKPGNPIADHIAEKCRRNPYRYVERQIKRATHSIKFITDKSDKPINTPANICIALAKLGVVIRHDKFALRDLIEGLDDFGPFLDDAAVNRLWILMSQRFKFQPSDDLLFKVLRDIGRLNQFHPVINYLDGLFWDSVKRLDTWLVTYGGARDSAYVRAVGALVLIAAVRRVKQPGCKFDELVVLEGQQGTERSSAVAILAVRPEWFSDDLPMSVDAQKVIERTSGKWFIEAAELSGMGKADTEHLKASLSRQHDRARMAYGRLPQEVSRQFVMIGTTNASKYLRDTTGNRRYWPVSIKKFDLQALRRDRDQLWAEAVQREASGESIRLDSKLWDAAAKAQSERLIDDPFFDELNEHIGQLSGKIAGSSIWVILGMERAGQRTQEHNRRMGEAMKQLGWKQTTVREKGKAKSGYVKGKQPYSLIVAGRHFDGELYVNIIKPEEEAEKEEAEKKKAEKAKQDANNVHNFKTRKV